MSIDAFTKLISEYEGYPDEAIIRIECSVRELRELAAIKENTMSSIEAMKAARDWLMGFGDPNKVIADLDAAIKAAQPRGEPVQGPVFDPAYFRHCEPSAISDERIMGIYLINGASPLQFARAVLATAQEGK